MGFIQSADNLNPYAADSAGEAVALSLLYDTLFVYDSETGEYTSGLCVGDSVSQNADGSYSWDLVIRGDVYWHDGTPLTASDVMFSLKTTQLFSRLYGSPNCDFFYGGNMTVIDDTHLSFVIWDDYAFKKAFLADVPILPEHIWNNLPYMQYRENTQAVDHAAAFEELIFVEANAETMIGSGPWRWGGYQDGVCRLYRNEGYWGKIPSIMEVDLIYGLDNPLESLYSGRIQACWDISAEDFENAGEDGYLTAAGSDGDMLTLQFNLNEESESPVKDPVIRQAVSAAINRREILDYAFGGGISDKMACKPGSVWQFDVTSTAPNSDPISMLEQNGYTDRDGDGIRESSSGEKLQLKLRVPAGSAVWTAAAECIQRQLYAVGIGLQIQALDAQGRMTAGEYDVTLTGWNVGNDPAFFYGSLYWAQGDNVFSTVNEQGERVYSGWNETGYANAEYDALYERFIRERDLVQRRNILKSMEDVIIRDVPVIILGWPVRHQACHSSWVEFKPDGESELLYDQRKLCDTLMAIELK